jgi:putative membrane protein
MKRIFILTFILVSMPVTAGAHGAATEFNESQTSQGMMRYIEDQVFGDELHEEMEGLMIKMMAGELTQEEANRIAQIMDEHAGPMNMMMGRMMGTESTPINTNQSFNSMMGFGFTPLGAFGWIFMILWWGLIIVGIIALVKWIMRQSTDTDRKGQKAALEILKERYAKGEIDKKEFEEKKSDVR